MVDLASDREAFAKDLPDEAALQKINYTQTLQTGTAFQIGVNSFRDSNNGAFNFLNPNYQSALNVQITQPLLRNRWRFAKTAPVVIARANLQQAQAIFQAEVNLALLQGDHALVGPGPLTTTSTLRASRRTRPKLPTSMTSALWNSALCRPLISTAQNLRLHRGACRLSRLNTR